MKKYKSHTLKEYLDVLASRNPTPGGGSAAALTASTGVALIAMVARYSLGKGASKAVEKRIEKILEKSEAFRKRLLECVDLDAQAYLKVVAARKGTAREKKAASRQAQKVPLEVSKLCCKAVDLTPFLVEKGNKYLVSDVEVAVELLLAAYKSAMINVKINQG
ncbi:MAG: cyclodeaminase/cyclohydrolase family protein [Candidatus Omnitrophica bacterium]|nr:cyclodeaminase/cyclohydrolase family protein [Candidatus Omnitrophota bacterium]